MHRDLIGEFKKKIKEILVRLDQDKKFIKPEVPS